MNGYFTSDNGKMIGKVNGVLYEKKVKKSKHLFRKWNAWAMDRAVADELVRLGVNTVIVHETEEKIDYVVSLKEFMEKGVEADYGFKKQIFLPIVYFKQENGIV